MPNTDGEDMSPAKVLRHSVKIPEGDMHKPAGFIKSAFKKLGSGSEG